MLTIVNLKVKLIDKVRVLKEVRGVKIMKENSTLLPNNKQDQKKIKTFKNLITEVHEKNLCGSCGGCVSFCSAHEISAIEMGEDGIPHFCNEDNCLECGICYFICPEVRVVDDELRHQWNWKPPIGNFDDILVAQATDPKIREKATDGGVVTALLHYMLDHKFIDGAIVSKKTGNPFEREPIIATNLQDLLGAAGSGFSDMAHVKELGKYTTYSPSLYALRDLKKADLARIAVVGTPCQIHTIRKMQVLKILPSHIVKYAIGLYCMENFSFGQEEREQFEKRIGINLNDVAKMNMLEDLVFTMKDGTVTHVSFDDVETLVRPACIACTDFANDFADISVGGLGSPEGFTTSILRTDAGTKMFKGAVEAGYIKVRSVKNWNVERTKTLASVINFAEKKRQRGLDRLRELLNETGDL